MAKASFVKSLSPAPCLQNPTTILQLGGRTSPATTGHSTLGQKSFLGLFTTLLGKLKHCFTDASMRVEVQAPHLPSLTTSQSGEQNDASHYLSAKQKVRIQILHSPSPIPPPTPTNTHNRITSAPSEKSPWQCKAGEDIQISYLASTDTTPAGEAACYPHVEGRKPGSALGVYWYHTSRGNREQSPTIGQRVEIPAPCSRLTDATLVKAAEYCIISCHCHSQVVEVQPTHLASGDTTLVQE